MAAANVSHPVDPTPSLPDYVTDPDAVLRDDIASWRYGQAPDYSKTRKVFAETKKMDHVAGSLPQLVENLVKNWEVEASFKTDLADWRTIDRENYTFAINGRPPQTGEHMLEVGTYNAIIAPNEYYCPNNSDFASSHKTFKRMMPTFAWEVLEVYSGPPQVSFRWRHWGTMSNDYVGFNDKGEKITAKAHGRVIDIEGVTVATVDDKLRLQRVETWFDPLEMFRQIAPGGIVNKEVVRRRVDTASQEHNDEKETGSISTSISQPQTSDPQAPKASIFARILGALSLTRSAPSPTTSNSEGYPKITTDGAHTHPKNVEEAVHPAPGEAVAAPPDSEEVRRTHEEMASVSRAECPFLMNRE